MIHVNWWVNKTIHQQYLCVSLGTCRYDNSSTYYKTAITTLLTHWSYCSLLSSHRKPYCNLTLEVVWDSARSYPPVFNNVCRIYQNVFEITDARKNNDENMFNTLRPRQNGRHFADDTFKRIFLKENVRISIKISLKFVPKSPIDNIPAFCQIMVWCRPGDKPLSLAMMVSLLTHICVAGPQWVNFAVNTIVRCSNLYTRWWPSSSEGLRR